MLLDAQHPGATAPVEVPLQEKPPIARWMSLTGYRRGNYRPGSSLGWRVLWYVVSATLFESRWFPVYGLKRLLLRAFGATVGRNVVIKPGVRIKYPWRFSIGDDSWIGEDVWIDNLATVRIGNDVCISQGAYLCTGSHNSRLVSFDLIVEPILVADEVWIAARSTVLPGVELPRGVLVAAGSVVTKSTEIATGAVLAGVPAREIGRRLPATEEGTYPESAAN